MQSLIGYNVTLPCSPRDVDASIKQATCSAPSYDMKNSDSELYSLYIGVATSWYRPMQVCSEPEALTVQNPIFDTSKKLAL